MNMLQYPIQVHQWDVFEISLPGKTEGNPFTEQKLEAVFCGNGETVRVDGFYDGDGIYRIRFMPSFAGAYTFTVSGTCSDILPQTGCFTALPHRPENHGIVRTHGFHFAYEDGTPFYPAGTTAYVWELQREELQRETLETLAEGCFNKIRFCVLPKDYLYNRHDPISFPYEGTPCPAGENGDREEFDGGGVKPGNDWNFSRFCPEHFRNVERAIAELEKLGIEADLILFHPYDRWGFSHMTAAQDDLYIQYVNARFGAYHNVWWSMANEFDLLRDKTLADWERLAGILVERDPYHHLRSIHNCLTLYDHTRPWITHCSIQRVNVYQCAEYTADYRQRYGKPVILDEIAYEGNIDQGWGSIKGEELVRRFWEAAVRGGYATHGETFLSPNRVLWWSHGGRLHGDSPARIRFLHRILQETPGGGLKPMPSSWDDVAATVDTLQPVGYYLYYYGFHQFRFRWFRLPAEKTFRAEIIDTWEMTITEAGEVSGHFCLDLPGKSYIAVRFREIPTSRSASSRDS